MSASASAKIQSEPIASSATLSHICLKMQKLEPLFRIKKCIKNHDFPGLYKALSEDFSRENVCKLNSLGSGIREETATLCAASKVVDLIETGLIPNCFANYTSKIMHPDSGNRIKTFAIILNHIAAQDTAALLDTQLSIKIHYRPTYRVFDHLYNTLLDSLLNPQNYKFMPDGAFKATICGFKFNDNPIANHQFNELIYYDSLRHLAFINSKLHTQFMRYSMQTLENGDIKIYVRNGELEANGVIYYSEPVATAIFTYADTASIELAESLAATTIADDNHELTLGAKSTVEYSDI